MDVECGDNLQFFAGAALTIIILTIPLPFHEGEKRLCRVITTSRRGNVPGSPARRVRRWLLMLVTDVTRPAVASVAAVSRSSFPRRRESSSCSAPVPSISRLCAAMYLSTPFGGRSRAIHVLLTSRFEPLLLAVGIAMRRRIGFCLFEHGRENGKKFSRHAAMAAGCGGFRGGGIRLPGPQRRWIKCS